ncbi:2-octaprenylphenol hydroxylase [Panacagrimonas perspica]|uniref:2-octaprenylphenol hydroxylase n=1 Tax=Panacagrimonas perspica TaxID=381431 RepID=A0A4S3KA64_9GAMM|nr:ubiquinone biosynthesis regulatory protein kinase UbiB [Panacagrimonas perspica]TDU28726.1 2-octaprenylphenol hydroxylase [Panacagrimonas perspica]THD05048.1 ubiquinone biosynthesis regulatory protein kinase UbiB [Panacagrimonas perspica]
MIGRIARLWHIHRVVSRYGLREFLDGKPRGSVSKGVRLREALEELGPVFIKFGQALSTRPDILPPEIAFELSKLQDRVPPFPGDQARRITEEALGKKIDELFSDFDETPLASASIAQVHTARLKPEALNDPGFAVVVKVLRPGVEASIRKDIELLQTLAALVEALHPEGHRLRPKAIVEEYEKTILDELDLMREGANCMQLRRNWLGSPLIYHPLVFFDFTRPNVLVMERLNGISIRELDRLREMGVSFQVLAERGVEIFFKQVFRDNFFHADMHPGNIMVDTSNPAVPGYLAVDFGIVGTLTPGDQRYLAENFLAFFNRDYRRVAELHLESEWIPAGTRVEEFESAIRTVCEPIFGRPIKDISFGFFLLRLFQVARRFKYQVQPQLVLLQKTLLQVEGLGRQLYPDLDLWKTAKPIMEDWMRNRLGPTAMFARVRREGPHIAEMLPELASQAIKSLERGEGLGIGKKSLDAMHAEMRQSARRQRLVTVGSAVVVAAAILAVVGSPALERWFGVPVVAWLFGAAGAWIAWRGLREPR